MNFFHFFILSIPFFLISCNKSYKKDKAEIVIIEDKPQTATQYSEAFITELSNAEYPNNSDSQNKSVLDGHFSHSQIIFERQSNGNFDLTILPRKENIESDTIILFNIDLLEWIPTIPDWIKGDEYLSKIGVVNQEWNRHQVKFLQDDFEIHGSHTEKRHLSRIDLARNCLNSYLWEIIAYTHEEGHDHPCYHGWFEFPHELYAELFHERNDIPFTKYKDLLETRHPLESQKVDLTHLRTVINSKKPEFKSFNNQLYPLVGQHTDNASNVIYPRQFHTISDFLTDSTTYASFSAPGFYDKNDPRHTELGKLAKLESVVEREVVSLNISHDTCTELELTFKHAVDTFKTRLIIGFQTTNIPELEQPDLEKGYQMPMGIANQSFYETYDSQRSLNSKENPYYAVILDQDDKWIDNHKLGVDGPLFYFDKKDHTLHLLILSFEGHAFVGHYKISL